MDLFIIILAIICAVAGLFGTIIPMLPGAPLSWVAILLVWLCDSASVSTTTLWVMAVIMVVVTLFDYILPIWFTNIKGGSKYAIKGATIGMVLGLLFMPLGIIIGPFIGAFVGELMANSSKKQAFDTALMSFWAFLLTTGIKILYGAIAIVIIAKEVVLIVSGYINS